MTKITVKGKQSDSIEQFYKNGIAENNNGSDSIFNGRNRRNDCDCYFCVFQQKKRIDERKEIEMAGEYGRTYWQIVRFQIGQSEK